MVVVRIINRSVERVRVRFVHEQSGSTSMGWTSCDLELRWVEQGR